MIDPYPSSHTPTMYVMSSHRERSGLLVNSVCFVSKCVLCFVVFCGVLWCFAGVLRVFCGVLRVFKKTVFCVLRCCLRMFCNNVLDVFCVFFFLDILHFLSERKMHSTVLGAVLHKAYFVRFVRFVYFLVCYFVLFCETR